MSQRRAPLPPQNSAFHRAGGPAAFAEGGFSSRRGGASGSSSARGTYSTSSAVMNSSTWTQVPSRQHTQSNPTPLSGDPPKPVLGVHPSRLKSVPGAVAGPLPSTYSAASTTTSSTTSSFAKPPQQNGATLPHGHLDIASTPRPPPPPASEPTASPWTVYALDDPRDDPDAPSGPVIHGAGGWASGKSVFAAKSKMQAPPMHVRGWDDEPAPPPPPASAGPPPGLPIPAPASTSGLPPGLARPVAKSAPSLPPGIPFPTIKPTAAPVVAEGISSTQGWSAPGGTAALSLYTNVIVEMEREKAKERQRALEQYASAPVATPLSPKAVPSVQAGEAAQDRLVQARIAELRAIRDTAEKELVLAVAQMEQRHRAASGLGPLGGSINQPVIAASVVKAGRDPEVQALIDAERARKALERSSTTPQQPTTTLRAPKVITAPLTSNSIADAPAFSAVPHPHPRPAIPSGWLATSSLGTAALTGSWSSANKVDERVTAVEKKASGGWGV